MWTEKEEPGHACPDLASAWEQGTKGDAPGTGVRNGRAKSREPGENIARPVGGPAKKCCQEVATHLRRGGRGALSLELMGQRPDPGGVGREERGGREEPVRITRRPPPAGQCGQCAAAARAPWRGRRPRSPPWSMSLHPCGARIAPCRRRHGRWPRLLSKARARC